ncbi:MAG: MFS transporter [Steroidobacteraceae bacterium]|nr:MFS transporter [Steroidobacteraceae bacterium]
MTAGRATGFTRGQWSWAMADWAREPFFSIVLSLIFPPYFVAVVAGDPVRGTALWGYGLAAASAALVLLSPFAGAAADSTGRRKPWIVGCVVLAVAALASLWIGTARPGQVVWVLASCAVAQLAIELSRVFTDSMVLKVAPRERVGDLSGLAVGLGFAASFLYVCGTLLLDAVDGRAVSVLSGAWLVVFILPLLTWCPDFPGEVRSWAESWRDSLARLRNSLRDLVRVPQVGRFLLARMVYWDGMMGLFSFIAILASSRLAWRASEISVFGLFGLVAGAAGGVAGGRFERHHGPKRILAGSLAIMLAVSIIMLLELPGVVTRGADDALFSAAGDRMFLALAIVASACLGSILASSRSMMVRLSPADRLGEFFGLYVMVGRASSFAAPLLVALATTAFGNQTTGVFSVALTFMALGLVLLGRVHDAR